MVRLRDEFHNCWGTAGCAANAQTMLDAVNQFAGAVQVTNVDPNLLISKGLTLYDGTVAAGGNRYESATIAKYEFKTGMGAIAYDTSGHEPALNLTMSGDVTWVGGWGINVKMGGKVQGTAAASKKLTDMIKSTGEFTVEAWANNANVAQEDAYIVSYSAGVNARNFTLSQRMYQYEGHTRSDQTGANGNPLLLTRAADMDAQAALQHVVMTYSPVEGRRFYVNGVYTGDTDAQGGGSLADWDDTFALVLGNETSTNRQWEGVMRMVAIHNRALTPATDHAELRRRRRREVLHAVQRQPPGERAAGLRDARGQPARQLRPAVHQADVHQSRSERQRRQPVDRRHSHRRERWPRRTRARPMIRSARDRRGAGYTAGTGELHVGNRHGDGLDKGVMDDLFFLSFAAHRRPQRSVSRSGRESAGDPRPICRRNRTWACEPSTSSTPRCRRSRVCRRPTRASRRPMTWSSRRCRRSRNSAPSVRRSRPALAQLAIQYCSQMVETPALRTAFFGNSLNPSSAADLGCSAPRARLTTPTVTW